MLILDHYLLSRELFPEKRKKIYHRFREFSLLLKNQMNTQFCTGVEEIREPCVLDCKNTDREYLGGNSRRIMAEFTVA